MAFFPKFRLLAQLSKPDQEKEEIIFLLRVVIERGRETEEELKMNCKSVRSMPLIRE